MFDDQKLIARLHREGKFRYIDLEGLRVTTDTRRFDAEGFWGRFAKDWLQLAGIGIERLNVR